MPKFYAVKNGRTNGIFFSWEDCKAQTEGFKGASYKSFNTIEEAENFINGIESKTDDYKGLCAFVDGSYNASDSTYGSGVVIILDGEVVETLKKQGNHEELVSMRNVAGEIAASVMAMRYAIEHSYPSITIYHDYEGIAKWCIGEWKTEKIGTQKYKMFYDSVKSKLQVSFVKVPAHTGVLYNEMADKLAKSAVGIE